MKSDNELIRAYQQGDSESFKGLYARYRDRVFFYALALCRDEHAAEEAVQEAFMEFLQRIGAYEPTGSFKSYLFSTVRCRVVDGLRKKGARREVLQAEALDLFENPGKGGSFQEGEESGIMSRALLGLPGEQREVVVLKVYDEMTFSEIARVTKVSENTAASRYRYALDKLKVKLEGMRKNG